MRTAIACLAGLVGAFPAFAEHCVINGGPYSITLKDGEFSVSDCVRTEAKAQNGLSTIFVFHCPSHTISLINSNGDFFIYDMDVDLEYQAEQVCKG